MVDITLLEALTEASKIGWLKEVQRLVLHEGVDASVVLEVNFSFINKRECLHIITQL